jgi:iron complex outermembrane receptor protein
VGQYTDFSGIAHDYKPYALVDARLTWQETKYKLYLEANNLLDKDYVDFGHVEQPGRWLIGGIKISL